MTTRADSPAEDNAGPLSEQKTAFVLKDEESSGIENEITSHDGIPDRSSPITYHYLAFETSLPMPSRYASSNAIEVPCPPLPDLTMYTSPFEWPISRKNLIMCLSCIATMVTAYTAGSYSPAAGQMSAEWNVSQEAIVVGITTFCGGFAIAPMVLAPFSEINGRYPVFVGAGVLYWICQICCAATRSYPGMVVARFFTGCGSSVFSTMVGGVVSDLYHAKDRNTPMALFSGAALFGTGLGPLVSGFIAQNASWRWVFWLQAITCGILVAAVALFFKETRGSILLSRKARALNQWIEACEEAGYVGFDMLVSPGSEKTQPQRIRWKVTSDEERTSLSKMIGISVYRPFHLLSTEPVVFFFSLWVSFAWAILYLTFSSIPIVFQRSYHFNVQQCGAVFSAMSVGSTLSTFLSIYQDGWLYNYVNRSPKSLKEQSGFIKRIDLTSPEARLYFACIESTLLPVGLFWFGWTQFPSVPWIVPTLSVACSTMGIFSVYLATFNYFADVYHRYASSALAAQSFCRNVMGGIFPLVTAALFNNLTFQGAASLLGGIGALLTAVPWVLVLYGPKIRARSQFASEIM